jgi:hypothetical protein
LRWPLESANQFSRRTVREAADYLPEDHFAILATIVQWSKEHGKELPEGFKMDARLWARREKLSNEMVGLAVAIGVESGDERLIDIVLKSKLGASGSGDDETEVSDSHRQPLHSANAPPCSGALRASMRLRCAELLLWLSLCHPGLGAS